jgi:AbrB family looped-hinge helix DNA binding protein
MSITTVSSKGQVVIPRHLRAKYRLTSGVRLQVRETDEGLVLSPVKCTATRSRRAGWRSLRGSAKGTRAIEEHLADHRREAKR